jgi:hypothetical protein
MSFREKKNAIDTENQIKQTSTLCQQNVKANGIYSNHWVLKGSVVRFEVLTVITVKITVL